MAQFINPFKMGLLGGVAAWANTMEKYNMQKLRAQNDLMLKRLQMESNQRSYTAIENGPDGKAYNVSYRNTYNPDTQQFEPHEMGRVPYESKMDIARQTQEWIAARMAGSQKAAASMLGAKEAAIDRRSAAREKAVASMLGAKEAAIDRRSAARDAVRQSADAAKQRQMALGQAEMQTNKDMKDFRAMNSDEDRAKEMAVVGVPATPDTVNDPTTLNHYRKALLQMHKRELGIGDGAAPAAGAPAGAATPTPSAGQPSFTPDGRQIKYDANGNAFIKGADGKPVPYTPDGGGSPLAMDLPLDEESAEPTQDDELAEGEGEPQGMPLLSGAEEGSDEESGETMPDDEEAEDEEPATGFLGGQYA